METCPGDLTERCIIQFFQQIKSLKYIHQIRIHLLEEVENLLSLLEMGKLRLVLLLKSVEMFYFFYDVVILR